MFDFPAEAWHRADAALVNRHHSADEDPQLDFMVLIIVGVASDGSWTQPPLYRKISAEVIN